jgi:hypothetical protein
MSTELNQGLLDAALEIGARRADTLRQIKALFEAGKEKEAVSLTKCFLEVSQAEPKVIRAKFPRVISEKKP